MKAAKERRRRQAARRKVIGIVVAGVLLIGAAVGLAVSVGRKPAVRATPEVTGAPRLKASPEKVDLGAVKLGRQVQVDIQVTNTGDQQLRLSEAPWVEVVEGC